MSATEEVIYFEGFGGEKVSYTHIKTEEEIMSQQKNVRVSFDFSLESRMAYIKWAIFFIFAAWNKSSINFKDVPVEEINY